jgi:hypothetical protein
MTSSARRRRMLRRAFWIGFDSIWDLSGQRTLRDMRKLREMQKLRNDRARATR